MCKLCMRTHRSKTHSHAIYESLVLWSFCVQYLRGSSAPWMTWFCFYSDSLMCADQVWRSKNGLYVCRSGVFFCTLFTRGQRFNDFFCAIDVTAALCGKYLCYRANLALFGSFVSRSIENFGHSNQLFDLGWGSSLTRGMIDWNVEQERVPNPGILWDTSDSSKRCCAWQDCVPEGHAILI